MDGRASRTVVLRLFCPRCLTPHERYTHSGTPETTQRVRCAGCGKSYQVTSRVDGQGLARCSPNAVRIQARCISS